MKYRFIQDYTDACIISLVVETTGQCGGDAGHGGQTMVRIEDSGSACLGACIETPRGGRMMDDDPHAVELWAYGDAELRQLAQALEDAGRFLRHVCAMRDDV